MVLRAFRSDRADLVFQEPRTRLFVGSPDGAAHVTSPGMAGGPVPLI